MPLIQQMVGWLARNAALVLAAGVFLGLALPAVAHAARPLMTVSIGALLVMSMMRVDITEAVRLARQPLTLAWAVVCTLVVSPGIVWVASGFPDPVTGVVLAIVLMAAAPPITSAPAMVMLLDLDADFALIVMLLCMLIAPFSVYLVASVLDVGLTISRVDLFLRLAAFVGVCTVAGLVLRSFAGVERIVRHRAALDLLGVMFLLIFAVAIMDGVTARAVAEPIHVLTVIAISFVANLGLYLLGVVAFWRAGWRRAMTFGFVLANCNMGIMLAVLPASTDREVFLYFAVAQIPMYLTPALLRPVTRRFAAKGSVER